MKKILLFLLCFFVFSLNVFASNVTSKENLEKTEKGKEIVKKIDSIFLKVTESQAKKLKEVLPSYLKKFEKGTFKYDVLLYIDYKVFKKLSDEKYKPSYGVYRKLNGKYERDYELTYSKNLESNAIGIPGNLDGLDFVLLDPKNNQKIMVGVVEKNGKNLEDHVKNHTLLLKQKGYDLEYSKINFSGKSGFLVLDKKSNVSQIFVLNKDENVIFMTYPADISSDLKNALDTFKIY